MTTFLRHRLWPAFALLVAMTVITGVLYPALVTAIAQVAFPSQANGSMIAVDGTAVGSSLIGQAFQEDEYFWGRPSAAGATTTTPAATTPAARPARTSVRRARTSSTGSRPRSTGERAANGGGPVPVDLVTTSASGLDPDISPAAAEYQVARVAAARSLSEADVRAAVARHTEQPLLGFLGQPRVNVLLLNLDLDGALGG